MHVPRVIPHRECKIAKLKVRRIAHLRMFMFKQKNNEQIVNRREINTRAHDAILFDTERPMNVRSKRNIYYNGALRWNELTVEVRNTVKYYSFKEKQNSWMLSTNYS